MRDTLRILKGLRPDTTLDYQGEIYSLLNYPAEWATAPAPRIYAGAALTSPASGRFSAGRFMNYPCKSTG